MYLSEKRLNVDRYKKWNDNNGGVNGIRRINPTPVPHVVSANLDTVFEDDEEEDDENSSDGEYIVEYKYAVNRSPKDLELEASILDCDVLQAFSHWTYIYTHRDLLVCDLQGELNVDGDVPRFELTDPCILSRAGKQFGSTDKGQDGMHTFLSTHHCNAVCQLLRISCTCGPKPPHR